MRTVILAFIFLLCAGFSAPASADELADAVASVAEAVTDGATPERSATATTVAIYVSRFNAGGFLQSDGSVIEMGGILDTNGTFYIYLGPGMGDVLAAAVITGRSVNLSVNGTLSGFPVAELVTLQ